jgi:putative FmdB family regulatory protein
VPLYRYRCARCREEFEVLVRAGQAGEPACPACGHAEAERLLTTFHVGARSARAAEDVPPFCGRCGESRPPCGD